MPAFLTTNGAAARLRKEVIEASSSVKSNLFNSCHKVVTAETYSRFVLFFNVFVHGENKVKQSTIALDSYRYCLPL